MKMQSLKDKSKKGKEKKKKDRKEEQMREGLNFNPRVTEFTDICTRIRLAVPHSFSNTTLSLLSIPKTYSPCYICHRMRPFTVLRAEGKNKRQNNKNVKANWIPSFEIERCLRDNLQPRYRLEIPLLYCILTEGLTSGKEKKMTHDK